MVDPVTNPLGPAVDLLLVYIVCFWNRMHDFFGRHEGVNLQVSVWKLWPAQAHLCHKNNSMNPLKHQKSTISSWSPYYIWLMLKKELTNVWEKMYLLMNIAIISNTMDLSKTYLPIVSTWIHFTINFNITISVKMNVEPNGQPYSYLSAVY